MKLNTSSIFAHATLILYLFTNLIKCDDEFEYLIEYSKCNNVTMTQEEQKASVIALEQLDDFPGFRQVRRGRHGHAVIYAKARCYTNEIDECIQCVRHLTKLTRKNCPKSNGAQWISEKCKIRYENYFFKWFTVVDV